MSKNVKKCQKMSKIVTKCHDIKKGTRVPKSDKLVAAQFKSLLEVGISSFKNKEVEW